MVEKWNLVDTTLREGEQRPGVIFSLATKKKIVDWLVKIGVPEIELGIASPLDEELPTLLAYCRNHYPKQIVSLWSMCRPDDLQYVSKLRPDRVSLSIPVSDIHLTERLGKNRQWALQAVTKAAQHLVSSGLQVCIGFEDATRADRTFLCDITKHASDLKVFRVRLADTVGILSPSSTIELVQRLLPFAGKSKLGLHTHNDFGMATANAVAGFEAGAQWADAALLGFGERAGCARLEELVGWIGIQKMDQRYSTKYLREATEYFAKTTGFIIPESWPLVGSKLFTCESGLHVHGLQKNPDIYEPYAPEYVGATRLLNIGSKSGKAAVVGRLRRLGYSELPENMEKYVREIRSQSKQLGRSLTDDELIEIVKEG